MSKKEAIYTEAAHEQDTNRMMEHINQQNATQEAAQEGRSREQREERVKTYRCKMWRYVGHSAATAATWILLAMAMSAELIAPVLAVPATYICTCYFGWCLCKVTHYFKKVGGQR